MTKNLFVIACVVLVSACSDAARISPLSPTPAVAVATAPPPPPVFRFEEPYTQLIIGSTLQRKVDKSANPACYSPFGCQYFRVTPDRDGTLDVLLTWVLETQPGQVLDLSHESTTGQLWADFYPPTTGRFTSRVKAGETSQITVWYTLPGVDFSLQALLQPN